MSQHLTIDYRLSPDWNREPFYANSADAIALRYGFFLGDIIFKAGDADFSTEWGWVPILDFAICLVRVVSSLGDFRESLTIDFTESDAVIRFKLQADDVQISASYSEDWAVIKYELLMRSARSFCERVFAEAVRKHPKLAENSAFMGMKESTETNYNRR